MKFPRFPWQMSRDEREIRGELWSLRHAIRGPSPRVEALARAKQAVLQEALADEIAIQQQAKTGRRQEKALQRQHDAVMDATGRADAQERETQARPAAREAAATPQIEAEAG